MSELGISQASVDRILTGSINTITIQAQAHNLPAPTDEILGVGHYGGVYKTQNPSIVVKITTDPTEVGFIGLIKELGSPDGLVKYFHLVELPETYHGRRAFAIWREAVLETGLDLAHFNTPVLGKLIEKQVLVKSEVRECAKLIMMFKEFASTVRESLMRAGDSDYLIELSEDLEDWAQQAISYDDIMPEVDTGNYYFANSVKKFRGPHRVAASLRACKIIVEQLANQNPGYLVGEALGYYLDRKILLADVHLGNVGWIEREGHSQAILIIFDPGHAIDLRLNLAD